MYLSILQTPPSRAAAAAAAFVVPSAPAPAPAPPAAIPLPPGTDFLPGFERVVDGNGGTKLRLKGASLQDLEALVSHLGHDRGEGGAAATARRLFRWMYHKVRMMGGLLVV